ncbi:NAR5 ribosyltransferase, partial [Amia calva]|nr:NAR5 ribosyltransferase [Amia calva]
MVEDSVDDQYLGCEEKMFSKVVKTSLENEINILDLKKIWTNGKNQVKVPKLTTDHTRALIAYATNNGMAAKLRIATQTSGGSRKNYQDKFKFKALHFLLTHALRLMKPDRCQQVFRGSPHLFVARENELVRFGYFTSTSLEENQAKKFGKETVFHIHTCKGVNIEQFSENPQQKEVLIPPHEMFRVMSITENGESRKIQLMSTELSNNCYYFPRQV